MRNVIVNRFKAKIEMKKTTKMDKNRTNKSVSFDELYQKENELLMAAEKLIKQSGNHIETKEYAKLINGYKTLLKKLSKIIKIQDRQEAEVLNLSNKYETVTKVVSKYIPSQVYESIFSGLGDACLKPKRMEMTVFFSDIINFCVMSQHLEPESVSEIINIYLNEMYIIAKKHGGTIERTIGDALLILFGAPTSEGVKNDARRCLSMAIDMRDKVQELKQLFSERGLNFNVRIGIHTGYCTVGNYGNEDRMEYTVVGTPVNLSSRIQESAGENQILISHETYAHIKDEIYCEKREPIYLKGFDYPIISYQVIDYYKKIRRSDEYIYHDADFSIFLDYKIESKAKRQFIIEELTRIIKKLEK